MEVAGFEIGAASYPITEELTARQNVFQADDGTVRVRDRGTVWKTVTYKINRQTTTQKAALQAVIESASLCGWSMNEIDVTDDYGTTFTARFWPGKKIKFTERLGRFWSTSITFLVVS